MVSGTHVKFNKDYKHKHSVVYEGQFNPAGQITGQWTTPGHGQGFFYINQDFDASSSSDSD